jgi:hypothetical protein
MLGVVPTEKLLAMGTCILDRAETRREIRSVLQGLELRFGIRIVIRYMRTAVSFGDIEIDEQLGDRFGAHAGAAIGVQGVVLPIWIVSINEIVERVSAIAPIDFLSIDIEGLDAEVLSAIDYSRFRPALICVEVNSDDAQRKTEDIFKHAGYKIINTIKCNLVASPA